MLMTNLLTSKNVFMNYRSFGFLVFLCLSSSLWALPHGFYSNLSPQTTVSALPSSTCESILQKSSIYSASGSVGPSSVPEAKRLPPTINQTTTHPFHITSSTSSTLSPSNASQATPTGTGFLRGVNIGGWLVLEKWMNEDVFSGDASDAEDQYSFDSTSGAADALEHHWSTWFTESDVLLLKSYGLNALRIPIGFWAYDNSGTPYLKGADAYLEKAIGWAKSAGLKVWVDLHGVPGSQNGFQSSGRSGPVRWQEGSNIEQTIEVLKTMAFKYGALKYADTVVGLELVNEPRTRDGLTFETIQKFAKDGYHAVKAAAANPNLMVVMHDAFEGPSKWTDIATQLGPQGAFGIDTHRYQVFRDQDKALNQPEHIAQACSLATELGAANAVAPTFVGEWSGATDICVFPDGSVQPGTSCDVDGCQCQGDPIGQWKPAMVEQVRRYVEAQLDTFEKSTGGYFFWSWSGPGAWGFREGVENGVIPNPVTERKFTAQCG